MDNLARKRAERRGEVLGRRGTVLRKEQDRLVVDVDPGEVVARRAAGCLLEPNVGDVVLLGTALDAAWVLTVLERDAERSAEISVEGDLRLRTARGKVSVVAQEGIDLISAGTTNVVTNDLQLRAMKANVLVEGMEVVGGWVRAEVEKVKLFAVSLDQVLDRFSQRTKRSYREVEDVDQSKAGSVHQRVEKTLRVHAHDTALTADGIVKIDGKQIHVG